jgi:hypothetical protein
MTTAADTVRDGTVRDEGEIRALLAAYCRLCDRREGTSFVREIFTADGVDDHGLFDQAFQGWDAIEEMFARSGNLLDATAHFLSNVEVWVDGDRARANSYVQCYTWLKESAHLGNVRPADYVFVGFYDDELVRTEAGWRIKHRMMRRLGTGALGVGYAHPVYFAGYHEQGSR